MLALHLFFKNKFDSQIWIVSNTKDKYQNLKSVILIRIRNTQIHHIDRCSTCIFKTLSDFKNEILFIKMKQFNNQTLKFDLKPVKVLKIGININKLFLYFIQ